MENLCVICFWNSWNVLNPLSLANLPVGGPSIPCGGVAGVFGVNASSRNLLNLNLPYATGTNVLLKVSICDFLP